MLQNSSALMLVLNRKRTGTLNTCLKKGKCYLIGQFLRGDLTWDRSCEADRSLDKAQGSNKSCWLTFKNLFPVINKLWFNYLSKLFFWTYRSFNSKGIPYLQNTTENNTPAIDLQNFVAARFALKLDWVKKPIKWEHWWPLGFVLGRRNTRSIDV